MNQYEYRVVPAPRRATKVKGLKDTEELFAHAMQQLLNEMGAKGWEYLRADTLPCEERQGLRGHKTVYQNMLMFRRVIESTAGDAPSRSGSVETPAAATPVPPAAPSDRSDPRPATALTADRGDESGTAAAPVPAPQPRREIPAAAPAVSVAAPTQVPVQNPVQSPLQSPTAPKLDAAERG